MSVGFAECFEVIRELRGALQEAHQEEIDNDHHGDGSEDCSYCSAIAEADSLLKQAGEEN
jgi:hypothetical protein